ncbi:hypothetical protein P3X46_002907 [Hevea brasiliensis]|uniref:GCK domain-containing protein n=1 Tax=Hevea brasiliensis TaxID=3981 RepID=A0ABQ9N6Z7_HEVBR|nr:uncharacterized protein LOC110673203 [Hevea brasiliensis]KAJ9187452.1 hypothetical protein P3X46_002907 [Hevea brasiliensis]
MGAVFSSTTTTTANSIDSHSSNCTMASADPKSPESATHIPPKDEMSKEATNSSIGTQTPEESDQATKPTEEEEEEGECGFCLFMKGGGCRDAFIEWENCVKEAETNEENVVDKCFDATAALRKCMQAHADYYEPILQAEKDAEERVMKELEKEKASESNVAEKKTEKVVDSKDSISGK